MNPREMENGARRTGASGEGGFEVGHWVSVAQEKAQELANLVTIQVQEHPVRTLAIVGAASFLIASSTRQRIIPALLKSGLGIAAAFALRELAEQGLETVGQASSSSNVDDSGTT